MSEAPARKQIPNTMYDQMVFPDYEFREYPLAVPIVDGEPCFDPKVMKSPYDFSKPKKPVPYPTVLVHSEEEFEALRAGAEMVPVNPDALVSAQRVKTDDDERDELYLRAEQIGLKVDKRWSIDRLRAALHDESVL